MYHELHKVLINLREELNKVQSVIDDIVEDFNKNQDGSGIIATLETRHEIAFHKEYEVYIFVKFFIDSETDCSESNDMYIASAVLAVTMMEKNKDTGKRKAIEATNKSICQLGTIALGAIVDMLLD